MTRQTALALVALFLAAPAALAQTWIYTPPAPRSCCAQAAPAVAPVIPLQRGSVATTTTYGNGSFTTVTGGGRSQSLTTQRYGNTTVYSGAVNGTSTSIGNSTFTNLQTPGGRNTSITAQRIGNSTFYGGDVSGSTTSIGNTTFTNINTSRGSANVTSQKIGNTTFYGGDVSGSSTTLGNTTITNVTAPGAGSVSVTCATIGQSTICY